MTVDEIINKEYGNGISVTSRSAVSGGDINNAYALHLSDGSKVFMKANRRDREDLFRAESEALSIIRSTNTVSVPEVLGRGIDGDESFLLMEFIERGPSGRKVMEQLGHDLAAMHLASTKEMVSGGLYGFAKDNYSGSTFQLNTPMDSWVEFFTECRLRPMFERVSDWFSAGERKEIDRFLGRMDRYIIEPEYPSLVHGDLWGGNHMVDSNGHAWIIDPSAYVGHSEIDIGMTELFGGYDESFYKAYDEVIKIDSGYKDRRDLYNLYHILNHLYLFGGGYLYSVRSIVRKYI